MNWFKNRAMVASLLIGVSFAVCAANADTVCDCAKLRCLQFGGAKQNTETIEGILSRRAGGAFMLNVDKPICAFGTNELDPTPTRRTPYAPQVAFHIYYVYGTDEKPEGMENAIAKADALLGKRVRANCYAFGQINARHLTPIMLGCPLFEDLKTSTRR